jgi:two-component system LytT family response regulator
MKKVSVIIIDDERSAREELKQLLKQYEDFDMVAEAGNADDAKELIVAIHPDLILLDIQMPERSGFELLESLDEVPAVLFTTAFNQYAVQAFELNALDYLMKPIRKERFDKAVQKVRNSLSIDMSTKNGMAATRQIFIKDGEHCYFVKLSDLYLIESLENYSRLYFQGKKVVLKRSLRQWEQLLDANLFFRINRTQIVNTFHIQQVYSLPGSRLKIGLQTGQLLEVSSRQSAKFKNLNRI